MRPVVNAIASTIIALALTAMTNLAQSGDKLDFKGKATNETRTKEVRLPASASSNKAHLKLEAKIKSGKTTWTLRDPNGNSRVRGEGSKGALTLDSGEMDAIEGNWSLEVEFIDATLDYEIHWSTR